MRLDLIRIAARQSDLARLQAYRVGTALKEKYPNLEVQYSFRASLGDINLNEPLWKMPEKGVFTEDFLKDLIEGSADLVVHSWKDLPTHARPETVVVATLPRADVRDLLLFRKDRLQAAQKSGQVRILTSSPRRSHNLGSFLKTHLPFSTSEVEFKPVRGNIPTRLKKMLSEDVDGLIVAKAAIDRLLEAQEPEFQETQNVILDVLAKSKFMVLPLSINPTAAAQGALAIEVAKKRQDLVEILASINSSETFQAVEKERQILAGYGGGCHQKIGVSILPRSFGQVHYLRGLTDSGQVLDQIKLVPLKNLQMKAKRSDDLFPRPGEEATFFTREPLPREAWGWAEAEDYLWVARESAWPEGFQAKPDAVVWTAGLKTWQRLAQKGVWVCGSAESLGEEESPRLEALVAKSGKSKVPWVKLTHQASHQGEIARSCATYSLKAQSSVQDLSSRTHFFWMSGSTFDRAVELFPNIKDRNHACGPGLTYRHLRRVLGDSASIEVYLSVEDWRDFHNG